MPRKKSAKGLPPLPPGALEQFKQRARDGILKSEGTFDYTAAIYLLELRKQKYAERGKKGDAKKWWKDNLQDVCSYAKAFIDLRIIERFPKPDRQGNIAEFGSTKLALALRYCAKRHVPIPPDPRDLTIQFIDDHGQQCSKPFPACVCSELALAVHGAEDPTDTSGHKLNRDQQGMLDAARASISGMIENPEKRVVPQWAGTRLSFSVLSIAEGYWPNVLKALSDAVNAFIQSPPDSSGD